MNTEYVVISGGQLLLASLLVLVNVGISIVLRLGLAPQLLVASVRMTVQLLLVGLVLEWIFTLRSPVPVVGAAFLMAGVASVAAVNRTGYRFARVYWDSLLSVTGASFVVTGLAVVGILRVEPWFEPQYLIPLLGMVLGNTLTGISLGLDRFVTYLVERRTQVEGLLSLGATRWEAAHAGVREALRTGMIPTINAMMVMGVVSLPGMMTGQILAGASPVDAVRYQIVIIFMIASAAALGTLGVVLLAYRTLFDDAHRLRTDRLKHVGR